MTIYCRFQNIVFYFLPSIYWYVTWTVSQTFLTSVCFIIPGSNSDNKCSIGHKHVLWKPVMWRKQIPRHFKYIFEDCTCNIWNALTLYLCIRSYTKGRIYHTFFIPSRPKNDSYMYLNCKFRVCELNTRV